MRGTFVLALLVGCGSPSAGTDPSSPATDDGTAPCAEVEGYVDGDGDGFGAGALAVKCDTVAVAGDCDDGRDDVNPEAPETWYDGLDADCAGDSDFDADADGADRDDDCNDTDPRYGGIGTDGVWPAPTTSFTLPSPGEGQGIYLPDVQASFPDVDWQTVDRLYLPAGHYSFARIGNLPDRDPSDPLVITNSGGQVRIGGLGHYYNLALDGGSNWTLTGRWDPVSVTGDPAFPGHRCNHYADTAGTYGILVDDAYEPDGNSGLAVGGGATAFELEYLEVRHTDFAGLLIKTDNDGDAVMEGVRIHDLYVHDTVSEGMYIGSTQAPPQHEIRGLRLYNNRVVRAGTEAVQIGQVGGGSEIHHNVFVYGAIAWRHAFQQWQDNNIQLGPRSGSVSIHHNVFLGGAGNWLNLMSNAQPGDTHDPADVVSFADNHFSDSRSGAAYLGGADDGVTTWRFERNVFRALSFTYDEVYGATNPPTVLFHFSGGRVLAPTVFVDNVWDTTLALHDRSDDPNLTVGNVSGSGNVAGEVPRLVFVNDGLPDDFDPLRLELWAAEATLGDGGPVAYAPDDRVMHLGDAWRALVENVAVEPGTDPAVWAAEPPPPDDFRVVGGEIGLLDVP